MLGSASCRAVIDGIVDGVVIPVVSPRLLTDLQGVLARPKFHRMVTASAIDELMRIIESRALFSIPSHPVQMSRDPDDDHLLSLAIEGGAKVVVSGDKDLTSLGACAGIPILTPGDFLAWLKRRHPK